MAQLKLVERGLVKEVIGISRADTQHDLVLNGLVESVSAQVEQLTGRRFKFGQYDQFFHATGYLPKTLWLHAFPLEQDEEGNATDFTLERECTKELKYTIPANEYILRPEEGYVEVRENNRAIIIGVREYPLTHYHQFLGYRAKYSGGYPEVEDPDNEPDDPLYEGSVVEHRRTQKMLDCKSSQ